MNLFPSDLRFPHPPRVGISVVTTPFRIVLWTLLLAVSQASLADGPADNNADQVRPIPPPGIELTADQVSELTTQCAAVRKRWDEIVAASEPSQLPHRQQRLLDLQPEILVFPRAVEMALEMNQFYKPNDVAMAKRLLDEAARRCELAAAGGDWRSVVLSFAALPQPGKPKPTDLHLPRSIIGGYQSRIDGSYQPYGLVLPANFDDSDQQPRRLDLWFHGRGETLSEVAFLAGQASSTGEYSPAGAFVLHPYGRYSNAFRFAGEVDVFEVLDYIKQRLPLDDRKIAVRGFSMGGAACWQFATRYPDRWFAANPGAGFSETTGFLEFFQGEPVKDHAPWYQQKLWNLYDSPPYAINLAQCPTVVYSGETDRQKQAADVMEVALAKHQIEMTHVIGPQTAHKLHPDSKREIESRMASLAAAATTALPRLIEFTTYTLKHHRLHWIDIERLGEHWAQAHVRAEVTGPLAVEIQTQNITRLKLDFGAGQWPGAARGQVNVLIDGTPLTAPLIRSDRSWRCVLIRRGNAWTLADVAQAVPSEGDSLQKRPGLQGPIDDAFMDSFVFVRPSKTSDDPIVQAWYEQELEHAMKQWRSHFRGDVRVINDDEVTEQWIESANLVLFGDAQTNLLISLIAPSLPIRWSSNELSVGEAKRPATGRVIAMVYPNPLNPDRYVVLNSGFTFREYDYLNNARQTPKLPDWAIIDVSQGATSRDPGLIEAAGFFDESWQP